VESRSSRLAVRQLRCEQLRPSTVRQYLEQARLFLAYLDRRQFRLEQWRPRISMRSLPVLPSPRRLVRWRTAYTKGIHQLLCGAQEQWPSLSSGDSDLQRFGAHLTDEDCAPTTCEIASASSASIVHEELHSRVSGCRRRHGCPSHLNAETPKSPRRCTYRSHRCSKESNTRGGLFP
jgi:hypothetical protein